jgi:hypothetical protein
MDKTLQRDFILVSSAQSGKLDIKIAVFDLFAAVFYYCFYVEKSSLRSDRYIKIKV